MCVCRTSVHTVCVYRCVWTVLCVWDGQMVKCLWGSMLLAVLGSGHYILPFLGGSGEVTVEGTGGPVCVSNWVWVIHTWCRPCLLAWIRETTFCTLSFWNIHFFEWEMCVWIYQNVPFFVVVVLVDLLSTHLQNQRVWCRSTSHSTTGEVKFRMYLVSLSFITN